MNIRIKLYALLDKYLPPGAAQGATGNEADLEVAGGATVFEILDGLGMPPEVCHLVLINGHFVAPGERKTRKLAEGDHLAVWPPVAGGGGKTKSAGGGGKTKSAGGGGKTKSAGGSPKSKVVEKEMSVTHGDFFRTLPRALGTSAYRKIGAKVTHTDGGKRLEITLGPERTRRIARLSVPVTDVTLEFSGYTDAEAAAALKLFDRMFQKGGG